MNLPAMLQQRRWLLLVVAISLFVLVIVAYWLLYESAEEKAEAPAPGSITAPVRPLTPAPVVAAIAPESPGAGAPGGQQAAPVDIFAVRNWEPPPPPPVADSAGTPAPPPPPQAPPLPFRYLGKLKDPVKGSVFFLAQDEKVLAVSTGDLIDGTYRVGKVEGGQLHFFYRPMKIQQTLSVGSDS